MQLKNGEVTGRQTPVGVVPTEEELDLRGMDVPAADLERLLTIDTARWKQEMEHREEHLALFPDLPEAIWEAHRRVAAALDADQG
jgi:phosphoenolpyruvate carboxykinase (GTP)